jgi:hypothetical protein
MSLKDPKHRKQILLIYPKWQQANYRRLILTLLPATSTLYAQPNKTSIDTEAPIFPGG